VDQESKEIKEQHGEGNVSFYVFCTRTYGFHLLYRQLGVKKLRVTRHPPPLISVQAIQFTTSSCLSHCITYLLRNHPSFSLRSVATKCIETNQTRPPRCISVLRFDSPCQTMNARYKQQTVAERLSSFIRYCLADDRVEVVLAGRQA